MRMRWSVVLALLIITGRAAWAADSCPWFTEGSAARILGGDVTPAIISAGAREGSCKYERNQDGVKSSLEIFVASTMPPPCPAGSEAIPGIGNEAVTCTLKTPAHVTQYQVDSRVREVRFSVVLRVTALTSQDIHQQEVRQAAEQIAGNLF